MTAVGINKEFIELYMQIFYPELIRVGYGALDKNSCLEEMADFLHLAGVVTAPKEFIKAIFERETIMSTGIGRGIAIPHARSASVTKLAVALFVLSHDLEYEAVDDNPVRVICMIAVPDEMKTEYMKVLGAISHFFRDADNRSAVIEATDETELFNYLQRIVL